VSTSPSSMRRHMSSRTHCTSGEKACRSP
jgi:hypothetical protein